MPSAITSWRVAKNSASSSLASSIGAGDGTLTVASGEGTNFPTTAAGDFWVSIDAEILLCTERTADVLTVTRGAQSTSGVAHDAGAAVELRITAESISEIQAEIKSGIIEGWVTDADENPSLGTLPVNAIVTAVYVWVQEAFNSDGTDLLTVGYDASNDEYITSLDVSTTGVKTPSEGSTVGTVDVTSRAVEAYYVNGGSAATTGRAHIVLIYTVATVQPA